MAIGGGSAGSASSLMVGSGSAMSVLGLVTGGGSALSGSTASLVGE